MALPDEPGIRDVRGRQFLPSFEVTTAIFDGFESPLGKELLTTVDWLLTEEPRTGK